MEKQSKPFQILNKIKVGWNLGNYLDAHDKQYTIGLSKNKNLKDVVKLWHNPTFNFSCFDELQRYGINCIRVPVTWYNFVKIENNNLSISLEIINYLKELISSALKKDFVIIIDMHHDDHTWLNIAATKKEFKKVKLQYKHIWEIVAREFKNYNENLIFEGMNEIIDRSDSNHSDWWGHNKILFKRLNILYKTFVKTVRKFSMLNKKRTLMISTYGAQIHHNALKHFKMVKDKNIIVDLHHYSIKKDNSYFIEKFEPTFKYLINKNIPIFLGEVGVKKEFIQDFDYIKNYLEFLNLHHIKFALWDNGSDRSFINRETAKFSCNKIKDLLTKN